MGAMRVLLMLVYLWPVSGDYFSFFRRRKEMGPAGAVHPFLPGHGLSVGADLSSHPASIERHSFLFCWWLRWCLIVPCALDLVGPGEPWESGTSYSFILPGWRL